MNPQKVRLIWIILLMLIPILLCMSTTYAFGEQQAIQDLHKLEDGASMELYGVPFDELEAQSNSSFSSIYYSIWYEQRINNVEQRVRNYLMIDWMRRWKERK